MNITIISPQANPTRNEEILTSNILKILPHIKGKVSVIQAIYAEDVPNPEVSHGADLTLYLKWESPKEIPKYDINDIDERYLIKDIPDINGIQVRMLGPSLIKANIRYFHYVPNKKKSHKK